MGLIGDLPTQSIVASQNEPTSSSSTGVDSLGYHHLGVGNSYRGQAMSDQGGLGGVSSFHVSEEVRGMIMPLADHRGQNHRSRFFLHGYGHFGFGPTKEPSISVSTALEFMPCFTTAYFHSKDASSTGYMPAEPGIVAGALLQGDHFNSVIMEDNNTVKAAGLLGAAFGQNLTIAGLTGGIAGAKFSYDNSFAVDYVDALSPFLGARLLFHNWQAEETKGTITFDVGTSFTEDYFGASLVLDSGTKPAACHVKASLDKFGEDTLISAQAGCDFRFQLF